MPRRHDRVVRELERVVYDIAEKMDMDLDSSNTTAQKIDKKTKRLTVTKRMTLASYNNTLQSGPMNRTPSKLAVYDFRPDEDADDGTIILHVGDEIEVLEDYGDGWVKGRNMRSGHVGVIPGSYLDG